MPRSLLHKDTCIIVAREKCMYEVKRCSCIAVHFKILLLTFMALHGMAPNYIRDLLTIRAQNATL